MKAKYTPLFWTKSFSYLFLGVAESVDDPGLEVGNFLTLSEFNVFVRFLDFFFVAEVGGVATDPWVSVIQNVANSKSPFENK